MCHQLNDSRTQFVLILHNANAPSLLHLRNHISKVLKRRPHHHRNAKLRRLQRIMAALLDQATSNKGHICDAIHRSQIADRIEHHNLDASCWNHPLIAPRRPLARLT